MSGTEGGTRIGDSGVEVYFGNRLHPSPIRYFKRLQPGETGILLQTHPQTESVIPGTSEGLNIKYISQRISGKSFRDIPTAERSYASWTSRVW